jgi:hypothetical protein
VTEEDPQAQRVRYLNKAKAAEMNAAAAETPEIRQTWLDIAATWKRLADQIAEAK